MTAFKYKNPPIVEALCEISFVGSKWDSTHYGSFFQNVRERYPKKQELARFGVEMQLAQGQLSAKGTSDKPLMRFIKQDDSQLIQLAENFLTINQLKPYCGYEEFQQDIEAAIKEYFELAAPQGVERIGLRYINQIVIPAHSFDLGEYTKLLPGMPEDVTTVITGFTTRLGLVAHHDKHQLLVTLGTLPSTVEGTTMLMLDLYDTVPLPNDTDFEVILKAVNEAHENIEHIFEGVITDKARALFEETKNELDSNT